ncbi:MAG: rRNA maturation RNase YbeY [Alphaproteobacteria bacterium]|nr:rRNA maturation RNase YbeY [Alphaproteobacteria bacterium]
MTVSVDVTIPCGDWRQHLPQATAICRAAARAAVGGSVAAPRGGNLEVSIVLADDQLVRALNRDYRGFDKATNVLSFPSDKLDSPPLTEPLLLGDIVLAHETIIREAGSRGISIRDHVSHLVVHGVLHLLGYDHERNSDAEAMERVEVRILAGLGIGDPYRVVSMPALEA